jgi:hypothetical protein
MIPIRTHFAIAFQLGTFVIIWTLLMIVNRASLIIDWDTIRLLPSVVSIYAVLYFVFVKWLWRSSLFRNWLVIVPDLQGTWRGQLVTTWIKAGTNKLPDPTITYVVIRQTLRHIHVSMFTDESASNSDAAAVVVDKERGIKLLSYSYSNVPKAGVRDHSEIHYGSARLRITTKPKLLLEGDYWTDRKSTGHMTLHFVSRDLIEGYPE